eukprot:SAG31_NODE_1573_length_7850_cov_1.757193_3_plen_128_part_00
MAECQSASVESGSAGGNISILSEGQNNVLIRPVLSLRWVLGTGQNGRLPEAGIARRRHEERLYCGRDMAAAGLQESRGGRQRSTQPTRTHGAVSVRPRPTALRCLLVGVALPGKSGARLHSGWTPSR